MREKMTFLAIDSQKSLFTIQKSQLQFEQTLIMNQANWVTKEMSYISQDYSKNNDENRNLSLFITTLSFFVNILNYNLFL